MGGRTAVVVDPSSTVRRLVAHVLGDDGWATIEAGDCADALETIQILMDAGRPPDLVLTSWVLGDGDAPALLRVLRHRHGPVPTAVMTSLDGRLVLPPGVEVLRKPFGPADLRALVAIACDLENAYQGA